MRLARQRPKSEADPAYQTAEALMNRCHKSTLLATTVSTLLVCINPVLSLAQSSATKVTRVILLPSDHSEVLAPTSGKIRAIQAPGAVVTPPKGWKLSWLLPTEMTNHPDAIDQALRAALITVSPDPDKLAAIERNVDPGLADTLASLGLPTDTLVTEEGEISNEDGDHRLLKRLAFGFIQRLVGDSVTATGDLLARIKSQADSDQLMSEFRNFIPTKLNEAVVRTALVEAALLARKRAFYRLGVAKYPMYGSIWRPNSLNLFENDSNGNPKIRLVTLRSMSEQDASTLSPAETMLRYWSDALNSDNFNGDDKQFLNRLKASAPAKKTDGTDDYRNICELLLDELRSADAEVRKGKLAALALRKMFDNTSRITTKPTEVAAYFQETIDFIHNAGTRAGNFKDITLEPDHLKSLTEEVAALADFRGNSNFTWLGAEWAAHQLRTGATYSGNLLVVEEEAPRVIRSGHHLDLTLNLFGVALPLGASGMYPGRELRVNITAQTRMAEVSQLKSVGPLEEIKRAIKQDVEDTMLYLSPIVLSAWRSGSPDEFMGASQAYDSAVIQFLVRTQRRAAPGMIIENSMRQGDIARWISSTGKIFAHDDVIVEQTEASVGDHVEEQQRIMVVRPAYAYSARIKLDASPNNLSSIVPGKRWKARLACSREDLRPETGTNAIVDGIWSKIEYDAQVVGLVEQSDGSNVSLVAQISLYTRSENQAFKLEQSLSPIERAEISAYFELEQRNKITFLRPIKPFHHPGMSCKMTLPL